MKLVTTIAALSMLAAPALAWTNTNSGHNNQIVDGGPGAQANQRQSATASAAAVANSRSQGGKGGSVTNNITSGGGGNNAGVALTVPGGYGNAPCGGGVGLGGLGLSGGGSGGGTLWEFGDCKRMRESSALLQLGHPAAALAELCQISRVHDALKAAGEPCPSDQPTPVTDKQVIYPHDWCYTRDAGSKSQRRVCEGK